MTSVVDTGTVVLYNADYSVLGNIAWSKAIRLLVKNKAVIEEYDPFNLERRLRPWPFPEAIRLTSLAKVNYKKLNGVPLFSKSGVLKRDNYKCCYCGRSAKTIDHVMPRSRGGANDYLNTVAACFPCNNKKDNKTPKEAKMPMRWQPYVPTKQQLMGRKFKSWN